MCIAKLLEIILEHDVRGVPCVTLIKLRVKGKTKEL